MPERVHVVARIRPFLPCDPDSATLATTIDDDHTHITVDERHRFAVDRAFPMEASTEEVFASAVRPFIDDFIAGFPTTVMAYGQTGTGKTYTMSGLIPLILQHMVGHLTTAPQTDSLGYLNEPHNRCSSAAAAHLSPRQPHPRPRNHLRIEDVTLQYVEVYGDTLRDLFSDDPAQSSKELQLFDTASPVSCEASSPSYANGACVNSPSSPLPLCSTRCDATRSAPDTESEVNMNAGHTGLVGEDHDSRKHVMAGGVSEATGWGRASVRVMGATQLHPRTMQEALACIAYGSEVRATGFTNMSESSSRSHSILTLTHRLSGGS